MSKKAFTIIELIVVMAIIAVLVLLAVPKFMNYSKEARFTRLIYDAALLEDACERYYLDHGDWPRASDTPYTAEQVYSFTQKVYNRTGKIITLEPDGKYYDIDLKKLSKYVRINSDPSNFILQNPVGAVYMLDPHTNTRLTNSEPNDNPADDGQSEQEQKPVAVISMTPSQIITTDTIIAWDYSQSYDPNGYDIVNVEWEGKQEQYTQEGTYTVRLRVQNSKGVWSDWTSITFYVIDSSEVVQVAAGGLHTVVLLKDGTVKAWGFNNYGQLGDGTTNNSATPVTVKGLSNVKQIAAGAYHTVALLEDGTVKAWGRNAAGQLGNSTIPVTVEGLSDVKQIDAGDNFTIALLNDGTVKVWGNSYCVVNSTVPVTVEGLSNVKQVSAGTGHVMVLLNDGTVKGWGDNAYGQLGSGTKYNYDTPIKAKISNVKQIAAGNWHTVALLNDGTVWAWGDNTFGELGNSGVHGSSYTPVVVNGLNNVKQVSTFSTFSAALLEDGTVKVWGRGDHGQYGNGTRISSIVYDVKTANISNVKQIAAGFWHVVALLEDGTVKTWGGNQYGQLGDGTTEDKLTPVPVVGLGGNSE